MIMNEKPLVTKMRENYKYFGSLSLIYGLIFTFCLYRNMHGITFPVCIAVTIVFAILFMKKINYKLQKGSLSYIIGMVLLGISTALTTSCFIHLFNLAGIVLLFFVFMIHQFYNDSNWNFPAYLKRILILFGTMLECISYPYSHGVKYLNRNKAGKNRTFLAVLIGCLIALCIMSVTLPLLLKSDIMFSKLFGTILKYINFSTIIGIGLTIIFGFTFSYAFFSALCKYALLSEANQPKECITGCPNGYNFPEGTPCKIKYYNPVIGITFTSILSFIYLIYCIIQIMYLFIGIQAGLPDGMTYARYARGGFWELLFVSIINFVMVLICMYIFSENAILKAILTIISGCTFIMIFSSAYRMILYIRVYHLTFLRILVLWFLIVLTLIMAGVITSIYKKTFPLFRYILLVISVLYIGFSFVRPDAVISKYNLSHWDRISSEDINYLLYNLSNDAAPYIADIDLDKIDNCDEYLKNEVYYYFYAISEDDENIYFRKANYSRIRAKLVADQYVKEHKK